METIENKISEGEVRRIDQESARARVGVVLGLMLGVAGWAVLWLLYQWLSA